MAYGWKQNEIRQLISCARPIGRANGFDLKLAPSTTASHRLVVVVPKKIGSAPVRNRCKRRFREIFRIVTPALPFAVDLIIFVRSGDVATAPFDELRALVDKSLQRALQLFPEQSTPIPPNTKL